MTIVPGASSWPRNAAPPSSSSDPRQAATAAPEHERIAALEAYDAASAPGFADHQAVDGLLLNRCPARSLADIEPTRPRREVEHFGGDQRIIEHEIGFVQPPDRSDRQELR